MGKAVKLFLVLALLVSVSGFTMSVVSAQQAGLTFTELTNIIKNNIKKINMGILISEYNDVREDLSIKSDGEITNVVIHTTFPDVSIQQGGSKLAVYLNGDVSSELKDLLSEKRLGSTAYIKIASQANENPTSRGLYATVMIPEGMDEIKVVSVSGGILVDGIEAANLDLESKSGVIEIMNSETNQIKVRTSSGDISVYANNQVELDLKSESGSILTQGAAISGQMSTSSGTMDLDFIDLANDLTLKSDSGRINVFYQGEDAEYDFSSSKGWIKTSNANSGLRHGKIGKGTYCLEAESAENGIVFEYLWEELHN